MLLIFTLMKNYFLILLTMLPLFLWSQAQEANLLGRWQDTTLVGSNIHKNVYNEIWGYAVAGKEYAILGTTAGTHFIEVTDPSTPKEIFFIPGKVQGGAIIHRDYHDYKGYLYAVADEGVSSLQIIDLQQLPDTVEVVYDSKELISRSHNIFIDTTSALLYSLISRGGITRFSAMTLFDISNPLDPVYINEYSLFGGLQASQIHDAYVQDNIAFLNLGPSGLAIVDFSDPYNPVTLSTITDYQDRGYNHSGWLSADCSNYYMADENHGFDVKVVAVSDLCEPEVTRTFNAEVSSPTSIPHNQVVACDYLYISYYYDGLRVYNIKNPAQPELALFYDTYLEPEGREFRGAWGVYPFLPSGNILVSDMQNGLFIFEGMGDNCAMQEQLPCSMQSSCIIAPISELQSLNSINIQPNPITNHFSLSINLSTALSSLSISLIDNIGQTIQTWTKEQLLAGNNDFSFSLQEQLPNGVYFLSLRSQQSVTSRKLVINNGN